MANRKAKVSISYNDKSSKIYNVARVVCKGDYSKKYIAILPEINMRNSNFYYVRKSLIESGIFSEVRSDNLTDAGKYYKFKINNTICLLDADDRSAISEKYIRNNWHIFSDVNFIFIFQYCYSKSLTYFNIKNKMGIDIYPLVYGVTRNFPVEKFQWENKIHKYIANFAFTISRNRQHRRRWVEYVANDADFFTDFIKGPKYAEMLQEMKWGVSIKGTGVDQDGKCFREAEFMSLGMPLALNYMPCYPFPFYPNTHYLYMKNVEDIDLLKKTDPAEYAQKSKYTWNKYFSPYGLSRLLINILFSEKYRKRIPSFWGHFISQDYYLHQKGKKSIIL